jgi:probable HAF family extracellular repeat protein
MIWHPATGYSRLSGFSENSWSSATGVSADGSIVVGSTGEAFRWTEATGPIGLGDLPGGYQGSDATAISANGKVIVGSSGAVIETEAFRWTQDEGMVGLGTLSPTDRVSIAENVSDDGKVIVGWVQTADGSERAFRWTNESAMIALGTLAGFENGNSASGVSGDGNVIVGVARDVTSSEAAFVWDQANGMRNLQDVLISDYGLGQSLAGWTLKGAADISSDGLTIVGGGLNPNGNLEAWLVRLDHPFTVPEPTSFLAIAPVLFAASQRRRLARVRPPKTVSLN